MISVALQALEINAEESGESKDRELPNAVAGNNRSFDETI